MTEMMSPNEQRRAHGGTYWPQGPPEWVEQRSAALAGLSADLPTARLAAAVENIRKGLTSNDPHSQASDLHGRMTGSRGIVAGAGLHPDVQSAILEHLSQTKGVANAPAAPMPDAMDGGATADAAAQVDAGQLDPVAKAMSANALARQRLALMFAGPAVVAAVDRAHAGRGHAATLTTPVSKSTAVLASADFVRLSDLPRQVRRDVENARRSTLASRVRKVLTAPAEADPGEYERLADEIGKSGLGDDEKQRLLTVLQTGKVKRAHESVNGPQPGKAVLKSSRRPAPRPEVLSRALGRAFAGGGRFRR